MRYCWRLVVAAGVVPATAGDRIAADKKIGDWMHFVFLFDSSNQRVTQAFEGDL